MNQPAKIVKYVELYGNKMGRYGKFMACSNFPVVEIQKLLLKLLVSLVQNAKDGDVVERKSKKNRLFYGCSNYRV